MQAGWRESEPLPPEDTKPSMNSSGPHYFGARRGFRGPRGPMGQLVVALGHGWWWPPLDEAPSSFSLYTPTTHGRTRPSKTSLWMQISLSLGNYLQITRYPPGNNRAGTDARGMPNMTTRSTILSPLLFFRGDEKFGGPDPVSPCSAFPPKSHCDTKHQHQGWAPLCPCSSPGNRSSQKSQNEGEKL